MDVLVVFVNTVAKHLLALFVDVVNVIHDDNLLFSGYAGLRLTKRLEFVAKKLDALFFQIVDDHDVVFRENRGFGESVIFADNGVDDGGLSRTSVSHEEDV
jgi:hypothetical protein